MSLSNDSPTIQPLRIHKPQSPPTPHYPPPPSLSSPPLSTTPRGTTTTAMAFQLPPGASSSANPLTFPDDDEAPFGDNDMSPRISADSPIEKRGPGLAERRARVPKPINELDDRDGLFAKPLGRPQQQQPPQPQQQQQPLAVPAVYNKRTYYPPPVPQDDAASHLVNRFASTASTSTTRASRGSPPPPETPVDGAGVGVNRFASTASTSTTRARRGSPPPPDTPLDGPIEARYAAAGISGTATLNGLQSAAAMSRLAQYGGQPPQNQQPTTPRRPWTPTESPGNTPHGPVTVYQGMAPLEDTNNNNNNQSSNNNNNAPNTSAVRLPVFSPPPTQPGMSDHPALQISVLDHDFRRIGNASPPPAYSSLNGSGYPQEKPGQQQLQQPPQGHPAMSSGSTPSPAGSGASAQRIPSGQHWPSDAASVSSGMSGHVDHSNHPAFAQERKEQERRELERREQERRDQEAQAQAQQAQAQTQAQAQAQAQQAQAQAQAQQAQPQAQQPQPQPQHTITGPSPVQLQSLASPPPLPEGWIAHLDQNSGQYYYIHLATQATQWEFPKGPTPLNHEPATAPLSPVASVYANPLASPMFSKTPMASPMFPPHTPGYAESIMSVAHSVAPSAFTVPPPTAGVDMYKVQPTNNVYFGPYLRYVNMDLERGVWLGSIMIVTDAPQSPTVHIHLSVDLSPNPRQLIPRLIYAHRRWSFYKYDVDLPMSEHGTERWTYAVTSHLGCTRYEFVVAGRHEHSWRFIAHSGNDFSPNTSQNDRAKLGGVGFMWKDVLQKNVECGGFHVQLGLGNQIYGDRLWKEIPALKQWLATSGRANRKTAPWTARHEEDVAHAYFHYYTSHFDQPYLREAFAQIPHVLQIDDHDIFDGFGSYPEHMQQSHMFQNIGRVALEMYLLFQHHTTVDMLRSATSTDVDLFTVTGHGWHFVKYLGPSVVVVGPDCRSERNLTRVMAGKTYQGIFPRIATLPPTVQHCILMISVPPLYPRLEAVESLGNALATGKKAVNTTYNLLGKMTSSVAGVVGGKEAVAHGFSHVKKAVGKGGLMGNVLNQFGDLDVAELIKDQWTHESKDLERTYLIRTLQGIAQQKGLRMTFLSGDVNCCGAANVHDPSHPNDHKTMFQIITSPIVAAPTSNYMLRLVHNNKTLYIPRNGARSTHEVSDTKEDMLETFCQDNQSGAAREFRKLMGRRNYAVFWPYDPDALAAASANGFPVQFGMDPAVLVGGAHGQVIQQQQQQGLAKLNIAVAFVVQGEAGTMQYGPVVVPALEFGH